MPVDDLRLEQRHYTGAVAEHTAAAYFLALGHQVYWPAVQQSCVDFVVFRDGSYQAVQVKTASWSKSGPHKYLQCRTATTNKYTAGAYDLLVVVLAPDIWIIPRSEIISTNLCLDGSRDGYTPAWDHRRHTLP